MTIQELLKLYAASPQVRALADTIGKNRVKTVFLNGLMASSAPMAFAALRSLSVDTPMLFILPDADEAGYFYHDLVQLLGDGQVLFLPSSYRRAVKYGQRDAASEVLRTEVLAAMSAQSSSLPSEEGGGRLLSIVTYPEAVAELVISRQQFGERMVTLEVGQTVVVDALLQTLRTLGFHEVDYVYEPGQFALRGSILDVYSYSSELPFRVDFFGDDIDTIRTFEVETQLSRDKRERIEVVPELGLTETQKVSFLSFLPADTIIVTRDMDYVHDAIDRTYRDGFSQQALTERMENATEQEQQAILLEMNKEAQLLTAARFLRETAPFRRIELKPASPSSGSVSRGNTAAYETAGNTAASSSGSVSRGISAASGTASIAFHTSPQPLFHKNFDLLEQSLTDYIGRGYRLCILADSPKQLDRLRDIFAEKGSQDGTAAVAFHGVERTLHAGFADDDLRLCVFTDHQIFDRFHKYSLRSDRARSGKVALTLKEIQQFEVGDYVVHIDHGIGKFGGLVRMPIGNAQHPAADTPQYQEMIKIIYEGGGAIYVSIHSLYKVSKYKAQDGGEPPRLSHLGTGQWERMKERTKQKLKDIARDLIQLYATRRRQKGFAFSADTFMQHELEASFLYEDTPDQLKATNDVKADMEQDRPMDRLVCGDVGFGKTEVAVRAAFKAACDSKQVAVLVPTTVLAYQHYQTFCSRLKDLPVRVDYLSRARSAKQTSAILKDLADGKIDILIGTHKLIGKSVKFRDLGLLIIDEEQKFGVSTKEKLRQLKTNVDTLTMSATPIPRTLQFSLVGARDLSIIQTPPPNRYPIQTEIHTFGAEIIADAINFEMSRNGQVYFVNPRINDLQRIRELIQKYVPDARIAVGHGQMKPEELEQIIFDFQNYDYDVLLSTTIVENGIDISNANTIIINGAHRFGLSDLHQMRGRVGRSNRKAFCYLLAPPLADLPTESRRRLEALENFSDLGYETYVKILQQAVVELRNEQPEQVSPQSPSEGGGVGLHKSLAPRSTNQTPPLSEGLGEAWVFDCSLESDLELYFPDQYVPSDSERMLLYRELDGLHTDDQLAAYRTRLIDRFGPVPHCGEELIRVVRLRRIGQTLGCEKIILKQQRMTLCFVSNADSPFYRSEAFDRILNFVTSDPRRCQFREQNGKRSMLIANVPTVDAAVKILSAIQQ